MSIRTISLSLSTIIAAAILIPASLLAARAAAQGAGDTSLGFFITSAGLGKGANLGGLAGADAQCQKLAAAAGAGKRTWRAYLSTQAVTGTPAVNARDRIGAGPWYNAKGVRVAMSVEDLHSADNKLSKENSLTEKGEVVKGRGDSPNQHDMLTGSKADGTAFPAGADMTCANWTSETTGSAMLGHHDRQGVVSNIDPASWNQAHASAGCSQSALVSTGGNGYFYCFAADGATALETGSAGYRLAGFTLSGAAFRYGGAEDIPIYILDVPAGRKAEVAVFSLTGTKLADLAPGTLPPGRHEIRWKGLHRGGNRVSGGFYLIGVTMSVLKPGLR